MTDARPDRLWRQFQTSSQRNPALASRTGRLLGGFLKLKMSAWVLDGIGERIVGVPRSVNDSGSGESAEFREDICERSG